jgi:hypothetical protein
MSTLDGRADASGRIHTIPCGCQDRGCPGRKAHEVKRLGPVAFLPASVTSTVTRILPNDTPPSAYWSPVSNGRGTEYLALVVPFPVRYYVLDGFPKEMDASEPLQMMALEVARLTKQLEEAKRMLDEERHFRMLAELGAG